jgi:Protein of unknown function (DUF3043)
VFSRNKTSATDPVDQAAEIEAGGAPGANGKGRPTPKRNVAQAANKRPLVPNDRRAAAKAARARAREDRAREYQAMQTGDEKFLPPRDKGPVKRYVRDYVDARWNLGEFFLPVAFLFIIVNFAVTAVPELAIVVLLALYGIVLLTILDAFVLWRGLKKRLVEKFGTPDPDGRQRFDVPRGTLMYAVMRAFQIRRSRLPRPSSKKHGVWPQ